MISNLHTKQVTVVKPLCCVYIMILFLLLLLLEKTMDRLLFYLIYLLPLPQLYVGITGNALQLIKSYFSGRAQRVVIDGISQDFASLVCGVPRGSALGHMKFCLYLLPLGAILRKHDIGHHIYADDTQLTFHLKVKNL